MTLQYAVYIGSTDYSSAGAISVTDGVHLRLAFILVALCEVDLFAQLADDIDVGIGDDSSQRGKYYIVTDAIDSTRVDNGCQFRRIPDTLRYEPDHFFVALRICIRHIVADADIAALQGCIQFAELTDTFRIEIGDAPVILTELLNDITGNIASLDKILEQACGYPLCILHVTLLPGELLDEEGVDQFHDCNIRFKYPPHWHSGS